MAHVLQTSEKKEIAKAKKRIKAEHVARIKVISAQRPWEEKMDMKERVNDIVNSVSYDTLLNLKQGIL